MSKRNHSFESVAKRKIKYGLETEGIGVLKAARIFKETQHILKYTELIDQDLQIWEVKGHLMAYDCYGSILGSDHERRN